MRIWAEDPCRETYNTLLTDWNTRSTPDQQAIDDVKVLRAALGRVNVFEELINDKCPDTGAIADEYPVCFEDLQSISQALAATDRPEYKEEG